ncbi:MAG: tetratricopeptide repeat protein [Deltaproteobacteria bacterium]|nr:tetratricopeptide repeat protein [Deltaproteobacteria bacterium]
MKVILNFMKNGGFSIFLWCSILVFLTGISLAAETDKLAQADAALQSPTLDQTQARTALELYESLLSAGGDEARVLERLTRVCFILGDMTEDPDQRREYYEKGRTYADQLLAAQPQGAAGHYWLAMNLCGEADACGALVGRKLLPRILEELHQALDLDQVYDRAGAHRVLGRIYFEAPGWPLSVGNMEKSLEHLTKAVQLAPEVSTNHLYLAETLIRLGKYDQARQELEATLQAPRHAIQPGGLAEDRRRARQLLKELEGK